MEIPEPVRLLARNPFRELPGAEKHRGASSSRARGWPSTRSRGRRPRSRSATTSMCPPQSTQARTIAREHGKKTIAWWLVPEHAELYGPRFEELGILNKDTPGFEAVENGLALVEPPTGERVDGVEVRSVETFERTSRACASLSSLRAARASPTTSSEPVRRVHRGRQRPHVRRRRRRRGGRRVLRRVCRLPA